MIISPVAYATVVPPIGRQRAERYLLTLLCGHKALRALSQGPLPKKVNCYEAHP